VPRPAGSKSKSTVDLATKAVTAAQLAELEDACNAAIVAATPVSVKIAEEDTAAAAAATTRGLPEDRHGPTRIIMIEGLDANMCCGTHVPNLSMLQCIKLLQTEPLKGNTRLHFVVGTAAIAMLGELYERVRRRNGRHRAGQGNNQALVSPHRNAT
jgi:misacylated tRNA(Ala) deacylase